VGKRAAGGHMHQRAAGGREMAQWPPS